MHLNQSNVCILLEIAKTIFRGKLFHLYYFLVFWFKGLICRYSFVIYSGLQLIDVIKLGFQFYCKKSSFNIKLKIVSIENNPG